MIGALAAPDQDGTCQSADYSPEPQFHVITLLAVLSWQHANGTFGMLFTFTTA